jgi:predicted ArsR family transcriptional regulator
MTKQETLFNALADGPRTLEEAAATLGWGLQVARTAIADLRNRGSIVTVRTKGQRKVAYAQAVGAAAPTDRRGGDRSARKEAP